MDKLLKPLGTLWFIFQAVSSASQLVADLATDGETMIGAIFVPSILIGLTVSGLAGIGWLHWSLLRPIVFPSERLRVLSGDARIILTHLESSAGWARTRGEPPKLSGYVETEVRALKYQLEKMRVSCPEVLDAHGWVRMLPTLIPQLEVGVLKEARRVWPDLSTNKTNS